MAGQGNGRRGSTGSLSEAKVDAILREAFVQARKAARISQERAARGMKCDRSTVERYESGETPVNYKRVVRSRALWRHFHLCLGSLLHAAWREAA